MMVGDPATNPDLDLREFPQDPAARQPGERLAHWLARRCTPHDHAPEEETTMTETPDRPTPDEPDEPTTPPSEPEPEAPDEVRPTPPTEGDEADGDPIRTTPRH